jgi:hypothetical protein
MPVWGIDIATNESAQQCSLSLRVPRRIFSHGYTGRFARSLVRRIPAVSTRNRAYAAGADTERRQSGFAISVGVSARCVVHSTRNQGTLSFWGLPAANADPLPVAPRIDSQGVLCDQHDAQKELIRSESQSNPRFGRVA